MKKLLILFGAALILASAATAQVSADIAEKCFKIMDESREVQAYHGDYSATISLVVEKPGKPKENLQYKIFERTDGKLMTIVQLFPEADKGKGYLRNDDNIWSYDPISRKFTHTSIKEALGDSDVKLDDIEQNDDGTIEIFAEVENFKAISDALMGAGLHVAEAELRYIPNQEMELSKEDTLQVLRVVEALDEMDDTEHIFHNMAVSDDIYAEMEE